VDAPCNAPKSYNLTLQCGCSVYVSCHPTTGVAHTRVIQRRGASCRERLHDVGVRLRLWELLPSRQRKADPLQRAGLNSEDVG
jgi:hypothetical protein